MMVKSKNPKYYTYNKKQGIYIVQKRIKGEYHFYASFKNERDAKKLVTGLKKADWDINKLEGKYKELLNTYQEKSKPKGYTYDNRTGNYVVHKYMNGEVVHFGIVSSEEEAKHYVEALKKVDYNTNKLPLEYQKYVPDRVTGEAKYYYYKNGSWIVSKSINGETVYYGSYPSEEIAKELVDNLKKNNWSMDTEGVDKYYPPLLKKLKKSINTKVNKGSLSNPIYSNVNGYEDKIFTDDELKEVVRRI